jgi:methionine-rich copper-binding protein CopC/putative copper export protein
MRRLLVTLTALLLSGLALLGSTLVLPQPQAQAHAYVIGSDPVDGSTIHAAPSIVRIYFNSTISSISVAHVYAVGSGTLADVGAAPSFISPSSSREMDVLLKPPASLPQGSYEVRWTAVSNADGHTTFGLIGFNLGVSSTGLAGTPLLGPSTSNDLEDIRALNILSVLSIAWEWLACAALVLWIGILGIERFVLTGSEETAALVTRIKRQTHSLQWLCLGTILVGELVSLILRSNRLSQQISSAGFDFTTLSQLLVNTNYGHLWLIRCALIVSAMGLLYWIGQQQAKKPVPEPPRPVNRTGPLRITQDIRTNNTGSLVKERLEIEAPPPVLPATQRYLSIWLLLAGLIVLTQSLSSEAAQVLQPHISAIVLDWLYRTAEGIWFGGVAYLGYVVLPLLPRVELEHRAETVALLLRRMVPYLLVGIGTVLLSALFSAEASISNSQQMFNDAYGRTLFVQLALLALALLLSLYALFALRSRFTHQALLLPVVNAELPARRTRQSALDQTWRRLKRVLNVQTWLAAGILLCASLLSFYAPPIVFPNITYSNPPAPVQATPTTSITTQTQRVGGLSLALQVLPGRVGQANTVTLAIADSKGSPVTNARASLSVNMQIMDMGIAHKSINGGHPTYSATFAKSESFQMAGLWVIHVSIQRPGQPLVQTTFQTNLTE